jgi:hypothetical protein
MPHSACAEIAAFDDHCKRVAFNAALAVTKDPATVSCTKRGETHTPHTNGYIWVHPENSRTMVACNGCGKLVYLAEASAAATASAGPASAGGGAAAATAAATAATAVAPAAPLLAPPAAAGGAAAKGGAGASAPALSRDFLEASLDTRIATQQTDKLCTRLEEDGYSAEDIERRVDSAVREKQIRRFPHFNRRQELLFTGEGVRRPFDTITMMPDELRELELRRIREQFPAYPSDDEPDPTGICAAAVATARPLPPGLVESDDIYYRRSAKFDKEDARRESHKKLCRLKIHEGWSDGWSDAY